MKKILLAGSVMAAVMAAGPATASPFTYEVTQGWLLTSNPTLFGTAADVSITVDNGSSSNISQTYTWADITNVVYKVVGGTFYVDSAAAGNTLFTVLPNVGFLTTDATGSGTLNIDNSNNPAVFDTQPPGGGFAQVGGGGVGGYTNLSFVTTVDYAFFDVVNSNWIAPATLVSNPAAVPEPATVLLLGSGLAGLAASRRRRRS